MSTAWEDTARGAWASHRVCDGCGAKRAMETAAGHRAGWLRHSAVPPGWTRVEVVDGEGVKHYCRACKDGRKAG
jgi:hypothetical protein